MANIPLALRFWRKEMDMSLEGIGSPALWIGFVTFVLAMLAVDLGIFHRKAHSVGVREAIAWSSVWVSLSLLFAAGVWWTFGAQRGVEFLTGYLIEKSLSIDNIFVFVIIFSTLGIPAAQQHRVLFWGITTALLMRAVMIFGGAALLAQFHWLVYIFGVFLVGTGVKLFLDRGKQQHLEKGNAMRLATRLIPATDKLDGDRFFTHHNGRWLATPLFMALVLVEVTDVIFAVDSIPAIFAVTSDTFIVFTSNIFAILGLRSMFFMLGGVVDKFRYLKVGLAGVLVFVGAKMVAVDVFKVPSLVSLAVIVTILASSVAASVIAARRERPRLAIPPVPVVQVL